MSDEEIDKAVKEAAEFEAQDKKRKEAIDTRNDADSFVFQTQQALDQVGEQIDPAESSMDRGYLCIDRKWKGETVIRLSFDMPVEVVSADPRVKADEGKRALMRGPLVYCMEGIDNVGTYQSARLDSTTTFTTEYDASLLCGVQTISAETPEGTLLFVPYYSWDNREACPMKVWVDYGTQED